MNKVCLITFSLMGIFHAPLMAQVQELSLIDVLNQAVENNLDIKLERVNVDSSALNLDSTRAIYEPVVTNFTQFQSLDNEPTNIFEGQAGDVFTQEALNFDTTLSKSHDFGFGWQVAFNNQQNDSNSGTSFGETYSSSLSFGFEQKLLKGFGFDRDIPRRDEYVARGNLSISKLDLSLKITQILETAENAYWDLVETAADLKVKENALKLAQQLYDQNKIKIDVGTLPPIELINSEATVANREADIVIAENDRQAAEDRLKSILNMAPELWERTIVPTDEPNMTEMSPRLDEAFQQAIGQRAEFRKNSIQMDNALLELRTQKNSLLPELNVTGAYFVRGTSLPTIDLQGNVVEASSYSDVIDKISGQDLPGYQLALNLTWTPFNEAAKIGKAKADVAIRQQELFDQQLRLAVLEEVRGSIRVLASSAKAYKAIEKERKFREENLKAEEQKFQNGLTTNYRVAEVQDELSLAISNSISARIAYRKALVAYYRSIGTLMQERQITVD